ncbi:FAD-binding protein [Marinomonas mediterranea]|uniref:FAD-binding oxidoreductase n=1 Tax=Marinomonas mediterranea TaxID=119864 RepID=UPI00234938EF|nr:FAD-binding oxidoreductase [Marinomonas mediterranea]WCN13992.1 FAD-binding protein [Marinomonas mediterranea]
MTEAPKIEQINPEDQRSEVLKVHTSAINNAVLFRQEMIANNFPSERLLTAQNNGPTTLPGLNNYQAESLIFNTRYQYHPFVIVMCQTTEEVQQAYKTAINYELPVRVRAGGHDHAGECSGDNVILIDVTGLKHFELDKDTNVATIGAGYRFYQLTPKLAEEERMIAHGTCATVGLTGFIQGGGWGPWTRKHGMCCESLVGATLILGDGTLIELSDKDTEENKQELLWALRGGGGMSYGIITELKLQTFALPKEIHRFEIEWNVTKQKKSKHRYCTPQNDTPTIKLLRQWEKVITSKETPQLLGTNLQINAIPSSSDTPDVTKLHHHSLMYGYWEGTKAELEDFIHDHFKNVTRDQVTIHDAHGAGCDIKYDHGLMSNWARNSLYDVSKRLGKSGTLTQEGTPFTPDYDAPAPHKLTSRFVKKEGLEKKGHEQLLQSLTSSLIRLENEQNGLFSYVTLGAIQGEFYQSEKDLPAIAFPYRDRQYTIQYQTWWNLDIEQKLEQQDNKVYISTNRAMDWIDMGREAEIENTDGAFISFKDPAIPTEIYFNDSYDRLVKVKKKYVKDTFNHLRTRKTII